MLANRCSKLHLFRIRTRDRWASPPSWTIAMSIVTRRTVCLTLISQKAVCRKCRTWCSCHLAPIAPFKRCQRKISVWKRKSIYWRHRPIARKHQSLKAISYQMLAVIQPRLNWLKAWQCLLMGAVVRWCISLPWKRCRWRKWRMWAQGNQRGPPWCWAQIRNRAARRAPKTFAPLLLRLQGSVRRLLRTQWRL